MTTSSPLISKVKKTPAQMIAAQKIECAKRQEVWREQVVRSMPNHVTLHEAFDEVFKILNEAEYHDHIEASQVMGVTTSDTMVGFHLSFKGLFTRTIGLLAGWSTYTRVQDGFLNISFSSKWRGGY
jgi:hypothetical protein|tara:strand:+ start:14204 stop:14581 length:378 start_codon:yes stop_codon:yes gene_type:complete